jgi:hypothetical protein
MKTGKLTLIYLRNDQGIPVCKARDVIDTEYGFYIMERENLPLSWNRKALESIIKAANQENPSLGATKIEVTYEE